MSEFIVSNSAEFSVAVKKAVSGDIIKLASGTYDPIALRNLTFTGGVSVTSLDPSRPAELTGLSVRDVQGMSFSNFQFTDKTPTEAYDFLVRDSSKISFDRIVLQGTETGELTAKPFMIRSSSDISVSNTEISNVRYGLAMLDNNGVTLTNNYLHDIRTDGFRGGGNSNVTISGNLFADFRPVKGDHADAIQFWTNGETEVAKNIVITDNVILRGAGDPVQGIFMGDEAGLPYENVVIDGNVVIGGMYSGISVAAAKNMQVTNNTVGSIGDQDSWIYVSGANVVSGNKSETYILNRVNVDLPVGNEYIAPVLDNGRAILIDWLAQQDGPAVARLLANSSNVARQHLIEIVNAMVEVELPKFTTVDGTDGADRLKAGKVGDFVLLGGEGNDQLTGGAGNTDMDGGNGNDVYYVNSTRDFVIERDGGGSDTVYTTIDYQLTDQVEQLRLSASDLTVKGNSGDNRIVGSEGRDKMFGLDGADSLMGMAGDDHLDAGDGDDQLSGGEGSDILIGGRGNDKLLGDVGDDTLVGGDGNDWLEAGAGADILTGGAGKDTFYYRQTDLVGRDTITDFNVGEGDKIALSPIDANIHTAKDDPFKFIGTGAFSKAAGELRYSAVQGGIVVEGDVNGDGVADMSIFMAGLANITAKEFLL